MYSRQYLDIISRNTAFYYSKPDQATRLVWETLREIYSPHNLNAEREQLIKDVVAEVMKRISVQLKDEASEAVKSLNEEIKKLGGQK